MLDNMRRRFFNNISKIDNINDYLTIVALEDGLIARLSDNACEYCVDGDGNWKTLSANANTTTINTGQTLSFKGKLAPKSNFGIGTFTVLKNFNLEGNCMSMLFGDDASSNFSLSDKDYAFCKLFENCTTLKSVSSGFLPATTLANHCYSYMFSDCTNLTQAPELPATTLVGDCYRNMFSDCTNLTQAPELPATTLASGCYSSMFSGTNVLPDCSNIDFSSNVVVASGGLKSLFAGTKVTDSDLERILPKNNNGKYCLPATTLVSNCYTYMFSDCTNLTQAPELPATILALHCYYSMFRGCINLTTAPELPATTLIPNCYGCMFQGCSKLNYIKAMFTTPPSSSLTGYWVSGVASTGTFVKNKNATWNVTGEDGVPSGWTVQTV